MNAQWTSRQLDAGMPGQRQPAKRQPGKRQPGKRQRPSVAFPEIMADANRTTEAYLRSL